MRQRASTPPVADVVPPSSAMISAKIADQDPYDHGPGPPLSSRCRVRTHDLRISAALHDAVVARTLSQSGRAGDYRTHGLGGETVAPRAAWVQGAGHLDDFSRLARAIRVAVGDGSPGAPRQS